MAFAQAKQHPTIQQYPCMAELSTSLSRARFKTSDGRLSKWMGKQINHALAVRSCLAVPNDPTICVVGFHGAMDSLRILSIGLKVRRVQQVSPFFLRSDRKSVV